LHLLHLRPMVNEERICLERLVRRAADNGGQR
jgi:hypothetical protein